MQRFILGLIFVSMNAYSGPAQLKVIYGEDNRVDADQTSNSQFLELSESTAAMISNSKLVELNNEQMIINSKTLQETGVCASERFSEQLAAASCSGFLVAPDKMVTAGHCIRSQADCENYSWVFNYKAVYENQSEHIIDKQDIYGCKAIISQELNSSTQNDYALIQLERENVFQTPLKYRTSGKPKAGDALVVMGYPSGLPLKIADGAAIRGAVGEVFFTANLDTYGGNSGSAVINTQSGLVEGILVRGEQDYVYNPEKGCRESNRVPDMAGRGEDVTLISMVSELVSSDIPDSPADSTEREQPKPPRAIFWQQLLCAFFGRC